MAMANAAEDESFANLQPCSVCSRTFRPEILPRHEKVCEKSGVKKRKVFDSFKNRIQGTDLQEFLGPAPLPGQVVRNPPPATRLPQKTQSLNLPKWKLTHQALIATVRAARSSDPAPTNAPSITALGDPCPTCGRNFGPRAFDRHVEFCREVASRKPKTPQKQSQAQERLEARTKYRAPLSRTKTTPVKPSSASTPSISPHAKSNHLPAVAVRSVSSATTPKVSATRKVSAPAMLSATTSRPFSSGSPSVTSSSGSFTRQGSIRGSLRERNSAGNKNTALPAWNQKRATSPVKATSQSSPKPKPYLKDSNDLKLRSARKSLDTTFTELPGLHAIEEAANKQLLSLLSWSSNSDISIQSKPVHPRTPNSTKGNQMSPTPSPPAKLMASPLHASPTSAFSAVPPANERNNNKDRNADLNDNDWSPPSAGRWTEDSFESAEDNMRVCSTPKTPRRLSTSSRDTFNIDDTKLSSSIDDDRNRRNSIISLASQRSDDTIGHEGVLWANLDDMTFNTSPLRKSKKKSFARSKSVFDDRNRMLFAQTYDHGGGSSSDDDFGLREIKELDSVRNPRHRPHSPLDYEESRPDPIAVMGGGDSAYSSLNRRSPRPQPRMEAERKLSKFCHECGSKYPVMIAKFCCECGVRRLII